LSRINYFHAEIINATSLAGVNYIGNPTSFGYCINTLSVSSNSVTEVGRFAFYRCDRLKSVNFPNITFLDNNSIEACTSLVSVSLGTAHTTPTPIAFGGSVFRQVNTEEIDLILGKHVLPKPNTINNL